MARKRRSRNDFTARKKSDSELVNFVCLVAGMITTLVIVGSIFVERDNRVPKQEESSAPEKIAQVVDDDKNLKDKSIEQLVVYLEQLNNWDQNELDPVKVDSNKKRINVANELLLRPLNYEQRILTIDSLLKAKLAIYGIEFKIWMNARYAQTASSQLTDDTAPNDTKAKLNPGANLRATAEMYIHHENQEISRTAKLAILKVDTFEYIRLEKPPRALLEELADRTSGLIRDNPKDSFVLANVKVMLEAMVTFRKNLGIDFMKMVTFQCKDIEVREIVPFLRNIEDQIILYTVRLDELRSNVWTNGKKGQRDFFETVVQLAKETDGGVLIVGEVARAALWFEQEEQYERAVEIYDALVASADERRIVDAAILARRYGGHGQKRCKLIGQPMKFNGRTLSGDALNQSEFKDEIVVILFWSNIRRESVNALNEFHPVCKKYASQRVRVLAVYTGGEIKNNDVAEVQNGVKRMEVIIGQRDGSVENSIWDQCPIDNSMLPYSVLVNHKGVVTNLCVPVDQIETTVDGLNADRL